MSPLIMDQIDPPWQTANIFVLFNAFETWFKVSLFVTKTIIQGIIRSEM